MKKTVFCLMLLLFSGVFLVTAFADVEMRRTVIGADLTDEQIAAAYESFGMARGTVPELRLSNAEEHEALDGFVDSGIIGTRSISCVYVELLQQGSGLQITTENISWFTPEMYAAALETSGIRDARIAVTAPFSVSGTSALAGIYKACEDMTGQAMDDYTKDVGTQEMTVIGGLAGEIGEEASTSIITDIKKAMEQDAGMNDGELLRKIQEIAGRYGVSLSEKQLQQLLNLARSLKNMKSGSLTETVEDVRDTMEDVRETVDKVTQAKDEVAGFFQTVRDIFQSIGDFFDRLNSLFDRG
ncbi:MAG: DUF1002 domain-containing protein [Oscillospiraceae bacterium]|nr:DUF1002 domain-containing protein [Oscillospiraceae bacterium]